MRIVFDGRMLMHPRVGIQVYFANLLRTLLAEQPEHEYLVLLETGQAPPGLASDFPASVFLPSMPAQGSGPWRHLRREAWEQVGLTRLIRSFTPDVYHQPNYYLPAIAPLPCASVATFYDASAFAVPDAFSRMNLIRTRFLLQRSARRADALVFGSDHARAEFGHYLGPWASAKGQAIPIGLPEEISSLSHPSMEEVARAKADLNLVRPYVLAIGTIQPRKNFGRLLQAMTDTRLQGLDLVICGPEGRGDTSLDHSVHDLGLDGRVRFPGAVTTPRLVALLSGAALLVYPSLYEGFGIPPLEAFHLGIPVAASQSSSIPEVTGDAAVLFDPYSVAEMAGAIHAVWTDLDLRAKCVARGHQRLTVFSWSRCAKKHLDIFQLAINNHYKPEQNSQKVQ